MAMFEAGSAALLSSFWHILLTSVIIVRCLSPPPKFWQPPVRDRPTCGNGACCVKDVLQGDFAIVSRWLARPD